MFKKLVLVAAFLGLTGVVHANQGSGDMTLTSGGRNAEYLRVYNGDAYQTREIGDVVVYVDGTYDGVEIGTTTTVNNALVAGVVAHADIAPLTWGWIQVAGYNDDIACDTAVAAGDSLITSGTAEASTSFTVLIATSTSPEDHGVFAVALADDSSSVCKGIIRLK